MNEDVQCNCIDTNWLVHHLHDPDVRVLEVSSSQGTYKCGHIPGAQLLDWRVGETDPQSSFMTRFKRLNIAPNVMIVLYGNDQNQHARVACDLIKASHTHVCVLQGGKERWVAEGRTLSRVELTYPAAKPEDVLAELDPIAAYHDIL